jgi:TPR repeat protein
MRAGAALLGGLAFIGLSAGSFAFYRHSKIDAGHRAFLSKDDAAVIGDLSPFSGWFNPQAETDLGDAYSDEKDFQKALPLFQLAARSGYARAENNLAIMYAHGNGVPADAAQAVYWMTKAADQGLASSQVSLGMAYMNGSGVPKDYARALAVLQKAADEGNSDGQDLLGELYAYGWGVQQDYSQAATLYQQAADQGNYVAEDNLADLYFNGQGVPQDLAKAAKYYHQSADQGYADAQFNLGVTYLNGQGVAVDATKAVSWFYRAAQQNDPHAEDALGQLYADGPPINDGWVMPESTVLSYMMFNLAVAQGNPGSKDLRDKLAARMTPEQIADAQSMSSKWDVGTPLPRNVPYEDWAPDSIFSSSDDYQDSRVWFSREFTVAGKKEYAVFMVTKGGDYHAAQAAISVATFDESLQPGTIEFGPNAQKFFAQVGTYGDVLPLKNPNAPYASPDRLDAPQFDLGHGHFAILVPDGYSGMGTTDNGYDVFLFDAATSSWTSAGAIATHDDDMNGCGNQGADEPPCNSWTGTVSLVDVAGSIWPEFVVHGHGTALDASNKVIPVGDVIYHYDGKQYSALPARGPAS